MHLGENHQKRDIPAGDFENDGKEKTRHNSGPDRMIDWIFTRHLRRRASPVATSRDLLRGFF